MAQETVPSSDQRLMKGATYVLGAVATADALVKILIRWGYYDWLSKLDAIVLFALLVVIPVAFLWREKTGRRVVSRLEIALASYAALSLFMNLLGH